MYKSSGNLQEIINGLPIPVLLIDKSVQIISANNEATQYFNSNLVGNSLFLLFRQPEVLNSISNSFSEGVVKVATVNQSQSEIDITLKLMFNPVVLNEKGEKGLLISLVDETIRGSAEEMRRDFVANVSHELKTPLTSLSGFIETLKNESWEDQVTRHRFLEIMEKEADQMTSLVRDLLSLSKAEVIEGTKPSSEVNLCEVLDLAKNALRPLSKKYNTVINLKGLEQEIFVCGDNDQLIQVFRNLFENSLKYGAKNSSVEVYSTEMVNEQNSGHTLLRIDIRDYGKGFDPVHVSRLTERFYRIDKHRSQEVGGTGLGLAIVKHILNRHHGRLEIESEIGKGSVFSVILPKINQG